MSLPGKRNEDSTEEQISYSETDNINFLALIQNAKEEETEETTENDEEFDAKAAWDNLETEDETIEE